MSFLDMTSTDGAYIKHHYQLGKFTVDDEPVEGFKDFLLSPDFYTGWGRFDKEMGTFLWEWDSERGVSKHDKKTMLMDGWQRAFSVQLYVKEKGTFLWQRFSKAEAKAFDEVMTDAWADKEDGKVVWVTHTGSEKITLSGGSKMYIPILEYKKWVPRPDDFGEPDSLPNESNSPAEDSSKDDDIPF